MILYFDNYITDEPLRPGYYPALDEVRSGCRAYAMPAKLSISMYSLASYAVLEWSDVIIKYELSDPSKNEFFENFILSLFPKAIIFRHRSDSQRKFRESVEIIESLNDEWVFFTPNNDHPFIASGNSSLMSCLGKAKEFRERFKFVSIMYSHFTESINSVRRGIGMHELQSIHREYKILDEDDGTVTVLSPHGNLVGIQIVHRDLLRHWFCTKDYGSTIIRRPDDIKSHDTPNQVIVIPKQPICAHFDGYTHSGISADLVPPLFIPSGFFEGKIRIAYGYPKYRDGWTNINPLCDRYSFSDTACGTDLKMTLDDIPLFWKGRIREIDINPGLDREKARRARDKIFEQMRNPWPSRPLYFAVRRPLWTVPLMVRSGIKRGLVRALGEHKTRRLVDSARHMLKSL